MGASPPRCLCRSSGHLGLSIFNRKSGAIRVSRSVDIATGEVEDKPADDGKNPAAVALGRLGGQKGGKARAKKLSPARRSEIAIKEAIEFDGKQDLRTKVMIALFGLFAEVERDLISERTKEGLAAAGEPARVI